MEICEKCMPYFMKLEKRIEELEKKNQKLEKRLLAYENAHTPPSKQKYPKREKSLHIKKKGRPNGYPGSTRKFRKPDRIIMLTAKKCPHCHGKLGEPDRIESKIIEDLPKPKQTIITEFLQGFYTCPHCGKWVETRHNDLPVSGKFGNSTLTHVSLMKFQDRLPYRKIEEALERQYSLKITPASIFDFTKRVSDKLETTYNQIIFRVRVSKYVYADETSLKVSGKNYWIWIFVTATETLAVIRKSRGGNVLEEILGKNYGGILICDGWKVYSKFTNNLQRCWAHLLRESDYLGRRVEEGKKLSDRLHKFYRNLKEILDSDPPDHVRKVIKMNAEETMKEIIRKKYKSEKVIKFASKVNNGMNHWFTFVTNPMIEATNNIGERGLREFVVQRKIIGTLRNEKGTQIYERSMTCIETWKQQGLNTREQLLNCLRS
ncbi:MAG: IS66 family transposase [Candidatus Aenigmarchaeota archaeon]|nr:IS66 family transposase [Candidatus Aenigmarchaeota archaeon]